MGQISTKKRASPIRSRCESLDVDYRTNDSGKAKTLIFKRQIDDIQA